MKRYFVTYGDETFALAKKRIADQARATCQFDEIIVYGPEDVSKDVLKGPLWGKRRGGGYWTWKPDIILQTLQKAGDGDIVVYVDGGCEIAKGREWNRYWRILERKELIVQRIYQVNRNWTRRSVRDSFSDLGGGWLNKGQVLSGAVFLRKTPMTLRLVREWRQMMLEHPDWVCDVDDSERANEFPDFIENRHDQTVLSLLVYRGLADQDCGRLIHLQWEHIENLSPFRSQVIRAMRNKTGTPVSAFRNLKEMAMRLAKDILLKPYFVLFHG